MEEVSDIVIFIGRFHPLMVHLPIGFLTLAIILELISHRTGFEKFATVLPFIWLLGTVSATVAVVFGYMLSLGGGYDEDTISLHKWSGVGIAVISFACYVLKRKQEATSKLQVRKFYQGMVVLVGIGLLFNGHLGGSLTHGSEYLVEFAPVPIQKLAGHSSADLPPGKRVTSLDSADIFADAITPIINSKCISCHNKDKKKGDLMLTSWGEIMKGGKSGPAVVAGSLASSELYRRITLPRDHKEFMPSEGKKPLTEEQLSIIEWWIEKEAPEKGVITDLVPDQNMKAVFEKFFGLGKDNEQEMTATPADTAVITILKKQGFIIRQIAASSHVLEARLHENTSGKVSLKSLTGIKDQLVWLQLNNCGITGEDLQTIGELSNLRKLNVSRNPVSDKGVQALLGLSKLEYLNLYETNVSDSILAPLIGMPRLKELYLWQTKVSDSAVNKLKISKPNLKIIYQTP